MKITTGDYIISVDIDDTNIQIWTDKEHKAISHIEILAAKDKVSIDVDKSKLEPYHGQILFRIGRC